MADIVVRRNNGSSIQPTLSQELSPLRMFRDLLRWDPFQEMIPSYAQEPAALNFMPAFEVKETKNAYLFQADLPGVKESDIDVTVTGNRLTVSGKREDETREQGETYYTYERTYGQFSRAFTLPEGAQPEQVHADLKSGVLTVAVPKRPEMQPKKIQVKSAEKTLKT